ncbi:hypothetical protein OJ996_04515 [Luteolibacter sp. GHJ8]|uniref:MAE-28990/MAE-18760-like HEPN domain-containing protein n=1 Tax=Luteolibacter rhizosphaerae TaxID=2989719 RepID=A0ABT3FYY8_9BACT|nr:hypothetical protein [Luteolibacter rhizosphaerae]MCW1912823.1 hypothetical protein [Luteolibacter rhizosphaerae]
MNKLAAELDRIGMGTTAEGVREVSAELQDPARFKDYLPMVEFVRTFVEREMVSVKFFAVPSDRVHWVELSPESLVGEDFSVRFKDAALRDDLRRALRCFAFREDTACVSHLVMLFESCVKAFAKAAGAAPGKSWRATCEAYEKSRDANPSTLPVGTDKDFMNGACRLNRLVAFQWRNDLAHGNKSFYATNAETLLHLIPEFVKHLASRLDEDGNWYSPPT